MHTHQDKLVRGYEERLGAKAQEIRDLERRVKDSEVKLGKQVEGMGRVKQVFDEVQEATKVQIMEQIDAVGKNKVDSDDI